jgi:hypothetical protein
MDDLTTKEPSPSHAEEHGMSERRDESENQKGAAYAQGAGKEVKVVFTAKDNGQYSMTMDGTSVSTLVFNKNNFQINGKGMKKKDYFVVKITLEDGTIAKNLTVPPNPMNAIWICTPRQKNPPECPNSASYDQQIYAIGTDSDKGIVWVRNEDMLVEDFQFTLCFLKRGTDPSDPNNYINYDPGGQNMNGGTQ